MSAVTVDVIDPRHGTICGRSKTSDAGYNLRQVLALDLPTSSIGFRDAQELDFYQEMTRRIGELPGVEGVALGNFVPWRDAGSLLPAFQVAAEGYTPANGEEKPHARLRVVAPGFFAVLGVPMLAGRDFTGEDRRAGVAGGRLTSAQIGVVRHAHRRDRRTDS